MDRQSLFCNAIPKPPGYTRSLNILDRFNFSLGDLRYDMYPPEICPPQYPNEHKFSESLVTDGSQQRWPQGVPAEIKQLIEKELSLIPRRMDCACWPSNSIRCCGLCTISRNFMSGTGICCKFSGLLLSIYYRG